MSKIPEGLKRGDRVRVVIEDEIESTSLDWVRLATRNVWVVASDASVVSVEKLEPPVEVFKPGDRLRRKPDAAYEITLADEGYLQHFVQGRVSYHPYSGDRETFNSRRYEKIEFIQPPF